MEPNYETLFRCQELWELVEKRFLEKDNEANVRENRKNDAKAMYFIQQALTQPLLSRIALANTTNEAWITLQKVCQGNLKIVAMKFQTLRQLFENLKIRNNEGVHDYITRVMELVTQIRALGDTIPETMAMEKLLRSLGPRFNHVITAIEESKDPTKLIMDEVSGSLLAHEARLLR